MGWITTAERLTERGVRSTAYRTAATAQRKAYQPVPASRPVPAVKTSVVVPRNQDIPSHAEIMNRIRDEWLVRDVHYPSPRAADIVLAWALHTHYKRAGVLIWYATPRLGIFSRRPQSGKTSVMEQLNLLCPDTNGLDINPTQYGLQYSLDQEHATILLDEGDISAISKATIAIWNAGYTPNGKVLNGSRTKPTRVPVFGPIALAALDKIKTGKRGDDLEAALTRTIQIQMVPGPHAKWSQRSIKEGMQARALLAWIAQETMPDLDLDADLDLPPWLTEGDDYRREQIWTPLFRVAHAVGGDWPERMRRASKSSGDFPVEAFASLGLGEEKEAELLAAYDKLRELRDAES